MTYTLRVTPPPAPPGIDPFHATQRQRAVLLRIVRACFVVLILTVVLLNAGQVAFSADIPWWFPVAAGAAMMGVALLVDLGTPQKKISTISGVFLGLFAGMLATVALGAVIDLLTQVWITQAVVLERLAPFLTLFKVLLGITLGYLGIVTVLQTQDDFRLVIPYVEFSKQIRGPKPLLLDSSALIDARIVDLAGTGIIQAPIVIPHFVIAELQMLADSGDRMRRAKGRRGLEVIGKLQRSGMLDVTVDESPVTGKAVDQMLIELARRTPGTIVTTDVALARIAQIQGVSVLNLHEVANALKPALIPGEQVTIKLVKEGEQPGQGVGYLEDGTMIVVEHAAEHVGAEVQAEVTSSLQTSAGRLIFARLAGAAARSEGDAAPALPDRSTPAAAGAAKPEPRPFPPALPISDAPVQATPDDGAKQPAAAETESATPAAPAASESRAAPATKPARTPFPPKPPARTITGRNPRR